MTMQECIVLISVEAEEVQKTLAVVGEKNTLHGGTDEEGQRGKVRYFLFLFDGSMMFQITNIICSTTHIFPMCNICKKLISLLNDLNLI